MKESYIISDFRETVSQRFPSQKETLNAEFDKRLDKMRTENADVSEEKQFHLERQILPGIAAYETLQTVMPKEEALNTVHRYVEKRAENMCGKLKGLLHIPCLYRIVPALFTKGMRKMFGEKAGFKSVERQTDGGVWRVDMLKCPYNDTCIQYGCPELCHCFCDSDDITYGHMHSKLIWQRTKTLGRGDDCCDFCVKTEGR